MKNILIILAVVVVAGVGYFAFVNKSPQVAQQTSTPTPTKTVQATKSPIPTATPDPTANWKTYTNTQYGFSFKYPNNLNAIESSQNYFRAEGDSFQIIFRVNPETGDVVINNPITRNVIVGGVAVSYQIGNTISAEDGTISTIKGFLSKGVVNYKGNKIYFSFATSDGTDRTQLIEQILSTFKFIQ